jgi:hypothetical protein
MRSRNGKELTRASMLGACANRAVSRLKRKYYEEYRQYYEEELNAAGITFNAENQKLLMRENIKLKELLKQQGVQV